MPKYLSDDHDRLMKNFFETNKPNSIIGKERRVMPINKAGYIVPCSLMIKILPNLDEGI